MKIRSWYAVHGKNDACPSPGEMLESIQPRVAGLTCDCDLADGQWRTVRMQLGGAPMPIILMQRQRREETTPFPSFYSPQWEDEMRALCPGPNLEFVIQHVRDTQQSITFKPFAVGIGPGKLARVCEQLCGFLARATDGLIHVFEMGMFNAEGESLHPYSPRHRLKTR